MSAPWPPHDMPAARAFLEALDPGNAWRTVQTFTDREAKPSPDPLAKSYTLTMPPTAVVRGERTSGTWPRILDLYQAGAGVYVTMNRSERGRREKEITHVRAVWCEADDDRPRAFPLAPSIGNETSPGRHHFIWLIDPETWVADQRGRELFAGVLDRMVADYAGRPRSQGHQPCAPHPWLPQPQAGRAAPHGPHGRRRRAELHARPNPRRLPAAAAAHEEWHGRRRQRGGAQRAGAQGRHRRELPRAAHCAGVA